MITVVLDNQALFALIAGPENPRHRKVSAVLMALRQSPRLRRGSFRVLVPTAVRVEVGWSRQNPRSRLLNSLRIIDEPLDPVRADLASELVRQHSVSVADAHMGATVRLATEATVIIITSDPLDMLQVCSGRKAVLYQI